MSFLDLSGTNYLLLITNTSYNAQIQAPNLKNYYIYTIWSLPMFMRTRSMFFSITSQTLRALVTHSVLPGSLSSSMKSTSTSVCILIPLLGGDTGSIRVVLPDAAIVFCERPIVRSFDHWEPQYRGIKQR